MKMNFRRSIWVITIIFFALSFTMLGCTSQQEQEKSNLTNLSEIGERGKEKEVKLIGDYVPGEILVKFADGTNKQAIKDIKREMQLETIRVISKPNLYLMKILDNTSVESMIECLKNYPEVKHSEPSYIRTIN